MALDGQKEKHGSFHFLWAVCLFFWLFMGGEAFGRKLTAITTATTLPALSVGSVHQQIGVGVYHNRGMIRCFYHLKHIFILPI